MSFSFEPFAEHWKLTRQIYLLFVPVAGGISKQKSFTHASRVIHMHNWDSIKYHNNVNKAADSTYYYTAETYQHLWNNRTLLISSRQRRKVTSFSLSHWSRNGHSIRRKPVYAQKEVNYKKIISFTYLSRYFHCKYLEKYILPRNSWNGWPLRYEVIAL